MQKTQILLRYTRNANYFFSIQMHTMRPDKLSQLA